ncbi:MAG: hypothetical protein U5K54_19500 [Cytophagales bacterium]|nr:hypothetical protein [Cytophagales bacterium]
MKTHKIFLATGFFLMTIACSEPQKNVNWYKGNLHTHTYWSDGDEFPEMVLEWYKSNGYDFVALSDHNTLAREEKWEVIVKSPLYEESFQKYLNKFGKDWVVYKNDTGRTQVKLKTFDEYKTKMQNDKFLIIPSEEITNYVDGKIPVHYKHNQHAGIHCSAQCCYRGRKPMQLSVDAVVQQRGAHRCSHVPAH